MWIDLKSWWSEKRAPSNWSPVWKKAAYDPETEWLDFWWIDQTQMKTGLKPIWVDLVSGWREKRAVIKIFTFSSSSL